MQDFIGLAIILFSIGMIIGTGNWWWIFAILLAGVVFGPISED